MARRKIVAGNWKMNMTPSQAVALCDELKDLVKSDDVDVVYCVPAVDIVPVVEAVKGTNVKVGAENMYFEEKGAYAVEVIIRKSGVFPGVQYPSSCAYHRKLLGSEHRIYIRTDWVRRQFIFYQAVQELYRFYHTVAVKSRFCVILCGWIGIVG